LVNGSFQNIPETQISCYTIKHIYICVGEKALKFLLSGLFSASLYPHFPMLG
jgi:hypothetical protein